MHWSAPIGGACIDVSPRGYQGNGDSGVFAPAGSCSTHEAYTASTTMIPAAKMQRQRAQCSLKITTPTSHTHASTTAMNYHAHRTIGPCEIKNDSVVTHPL
eukprot:m.1102452 g.1102452  ORF g.1102452 m.1102452 type:complete len:101 (+) comp24326_c0_seq80:1808-2110(+)